MADKHETACSKNGQVLHAHEVYGELRVFDPSEVDKAVEQLANLSRTAPLKVAVCYTTEKESKVIPLSETIKKYAEDLLENNGIPPDFQRFPFDVKDTGVGNQPYHPDGMLGAVNRIAYAIKSLEGRIEWTQKFKRPHLQDFHRIIFPSLESDIMERETGPAYDKPNVFFYEYRTKTAIAGWGRGPGCQEDLLKIAQGKGGNKKDFTYGSVLEENFSGGKNSKGQIVKVSGSDWQGVVLGCDKEGRQRDRAYFVRELCDHMVKNGLDKWFKDVFSEFLPETSGEHDTVGPDGVA